MTERVVVASLLAKSLKTENERFSSLQTALYNFPLITTGLFTNVRYTLMLPFQTRLMFSFARLIILPVIMGYFYNVNYN